MQDQKMKAIIATFILIILALALTPTLAGFVGDSAYQPYTEQKTIVSGTSNSTSALTNNARNDSLTYAYFVITLDQANMYGVTTVDVTTNITYTESTKVIAFDVGVFDKTKTYVCTITYFTDDYTSAASLALIAIVPIMWVVIILAVGIVAISHQLKQ